MCLFKSVFINTSIFSFVKNVPSDVWEGEVRQQERVSETGEKQGGDRQMWERDLERLLTLHQAQGKSNQAISKPRRSAPATLAPHNYNTIWQRYWAQIPCYFFGCVYPARTWFYIKVPKMALTLTYWKERPWSQAERANSKNMFTLQNPGETTHNVTKELIFLSEVEGVILKRWPLPPHHLLKGSLVTFYRVESERRKEQLLWMRAGWGKDYDKLLSCPCDERQRFGFTLTLEVRWRMQEGKRFFRRFCLFILEPRERLFFSVDSVILTPKQNYHLGLLVMHWTLRYPRGFLKIKSNNKSLLG